jgi:diphthamide synthase (EF-2-diphthine--ammonia ligase)
MFLMEKEEVQSVLKKINNYLSRCLWMDFEFCQMNASQVVMAGSIDQSYDKYAIDIIFEQPHFVSSMFLWKTDTSKPFIQLVSKEEEFEIITKYQVEQGNYIFKIYVEDFENPPILIAAKKIICNILDENPFPEN